MMRKGVNRHTNSYVLHLQNELCGQNALSDNFVYIFFRMLLIRRVRFFVLFNRCCDPVVICLVKLNALLRMIQWYLAINNFGSISHCRCVCIGRRWRYHFRRLFPEVECRILFLSQINNVSVSIHTSINIAVEIELRWQTNRTAKAEWKKPHTQNG